VLFFIHLESRRVEIAGITPHPNEAWMKQIARNVTMDEWGSMSRASTSCSASPNGRGRRRLSRSTAWGSTRMPGTIGCVMHFSNSLADTDRKVPGFCHSCRLRLLADLALP
jgi:hypothetical protein